VRGAGRQFSAAANWRNAAVASRREFEGARKTLRRSAGFTLIELLVTLTLLGLLSVLLFGGLRFGARAWDAGSTQLAALGEVEAVQMLLHNQLGQITLPRQVRTEDERAPMFSGSPGALRYVAPLPIHRGIGGLYVFELGMAEGGADLALSWRLHRPDVALAERTAEQADRRVLLADVAGVSFSYFGRPKPEDPLGWYDNWDARSGLPLLIRVEVAFNAEDKRRWPELIVAPMFGRGATVIEEPEVAAP
jgi:general secretion pathway protein J